MDAKLIYVTDEEFDILSKNLNMGSLSYDSIRLESKIVFMRDKFKEPEMPTKPIMTRAEATILLRDSVFGLTNTGQAMKWVDFFIATGMLEIKEEDEPIFEIKGKHGSPLHIKIWANGKIEGIAAIVINRIQQYLENNR